jgi:anti-sigma factor RsiW
MSDHPSSPMTHPEELLAAYVDGALEHSERRAAEAHLAVCGSCRQDVEHAAAARAALLALPDLEAPGLADKGLAGLGVATSAPADLAGHRRGREWGQRWGRVAWSAGLAAAAVVAVVFLVTGGLFSGEDQAGSPAAVEQPRFGAATGQPLEIVQGGERTPTELDALAKTLASSSESKASLQVSPPPASRSSAEAGDASGTVGAVTTCVREGAALGPENPPIYLEEATFQGTPIYVGAFLVAPDGGGPAHLELVAVTRDDCQPVYFARRNL